MRNDTNHPKKEYKNYYENDKNIYLDDEEEESFNPNKILY